MASTNISRCDLKSIKVGFIGGGNMASAIGAGLIRKGILNPDNVWVSARTDRTLGFWNDLGAHATLKNGEVVDNCEIVFLAMKPHMLDDALEGVKATISKKIVHVLFVSVLVGVELDTLASGVHAKASHSSIFSAFNDMNNHPCYNLNGFKEEIPWKNNLLCRIIFFSFLKFRVIEKQRRYLDDLLQFGHHKLKSVILHPRIIRCMPNTPMMVGEGITVYCSMDTTDQDEYIIQTLFSFIGVSEKVPESLINAIGGLSGSGPAYAYLIIEALADGAVKMGVPRPMATKFAAQVLIGAGKMVLETGRHPGQLKDEVCSPGGTTITGVHAMERGQVRASMMNAVEAAVNKSKELGSKLK